MIVTHDSQQYNICGWWMFFADAASNTKLLLCLLITFFILNLETDR